MKFSVVKQLNQPETGENFFSWYVTHLVDNSPDPADNGKWVFVGDFRNKVEMEEFCHEFVDTYEHHVFDLAPTVA